jgi:HK97 gp10 family phage protein
VQVLTNIQGLDALKRKLELLPERVGRNAARRALRKGANVIRDAVRANAKGIDDPESREMIWKNVAVASGGSRREKAAGGVMMRVGIRGGARPTSGDNGAPGGNTTHWRFIEFGTSQARAQPFMRPAFNSASGRAAQVAIDAMAKEFDKEAAKLAAMP